MTLEVMAMHIGEKIRRIRQKLGITQRELAQRLNVEQATISHYEQGKRAVSLDMLSKIAQALGVPLKVFFEDCEIEPTELLQARKMIPVFDINVAAGNGIFPDTAYAVKFIPADYVDADCAFIVHGRSMSPEVEDGDIVLVKHVPVSDITQGEMVVCILGNSYLLKRFYRRNQNIVLVSSNEEYGVIFVDGTERFEIVGRVVEIRRVPKRRGHKGV